MKQQRRKKQYKRWLDRNAMKIMCRYCQAYEFCPNKEVKESYEKDGIMTRCTHTPNKKQKVMSYEKVNKKGEIYNVNKHGIPRNRWFFDEVKLSPRDRSKREGGKGAAKPVGRKPNQGQRNRRPEGKGRQPDRG